MGRMKDLQIEIDMLEGKVTEPLQYYSDRIEQQHQELLDKDSEIMMLRSRVMQLESQLSMAQCSAMGRSL